VREPIQVLVYVARRMEREWQYLLLHRVARGDDFWQGVTGGLESGETPLQAAYRELREETGFTTRRLVDLAYTYTFAVADKWRDLYAADVCEIVEHVFVAEMADETDPRIDRSEHDSWRWCSFDEALRLLHWPDNVKALRRAHAMLTDREAGLAQGARQPRCTAR
jgi:dihydroneopterin triphosphate diphosphatase